MAIVTNGLVGYWNSKQGVNGAQWEDLSGNGKHGTIVGAILQTDAMVFDGVDDYISIPALGLTGTSFTIEVWFDWDSAGASTLPTMVGYDSNHRICIAKAFNVVRNYYAGYGSMTGTTIIPINTLTHLRVEYNHATTNETFFVNNVLERSQSGYVHDWTNTFSLGKSLNQTSSNLKGKIYAVRFYNRLLTQEEKDQNYAEGTNIGLGTPSTPPSVTIVNIDKTKISNKTGADRANVTFKFDKGITEYTVRVGGTSPVTGINAQSAIQTITANTNITAEIDYTEGLSEGSNRINIYGKGADGQWTPYEP